MPDAVLNHDRWACHFQYNTKHHQICTAHLRRKLNNINVIYLGDWSAHFKFIVTRAIELKNKLNPTDYNFKNTAQQIPESKLYKLLHIKSLNKNKKAITLQKKLANISSCIFYFLYHSKFVSYKKGSERAIRNNEVKQKIYGQFKSVEGAISFAVISSVITAISSGQNVLNTLSYRAKIATQ